MQFNPTEYRVDEGNSVLLLCELSLQAERDVFVTFSTLDGTAGKKCALYFVGVVYIIYMVFLFLATNDYASVRTSLIFPAGVTSVSIIVNTLNDNVTEAEENFEVRLFDPISGLDVAQASITIVDEDGK